MNETERKLLTDLRRALLQLHKTLIEWERGAYEKVHGRQSAGELLNVLMNNPQFAWLRPVSELIVRIDEALESDAPADVDAAAIISHARTLISPSETGTPYAQRYHQALQDHPDAVFAHRAVTVVLKDTGRKETLH